MTIMNLISSATARAENQLVMQTQFHFSFPARFLVRLDDEPLLTTENIVWLTVGIATPGEAAFIVRTTPRSVGSSISCRLRSACSSGSSTGRGAPFECLVLEFRVRPLRPRRPVVEERRRFGGANKTGQTKATLFDIENSKLIIQSLIR
jgi:hypothetical protein